MRGDPCATALPILLCVARQRPIQRVLECGAGEYSTGTFLNRRGFPDLERLDSLDNNAEWADRIERLNADSRLALRCVPKTADGLSGYDLDSYDLILVDDSTDPRFRVDTLEAVGKRHPLRPVIVVHDYERNEYREVCEKLFSHAVCIAGLTPHTGLAWNGKGPTPDEVDALADSVARGSVALDPSDLQGWTDFLDQEAMQ